MTFVEPLGNLKNLDSRSPLQVFLGKTAIEYVVNQIYKLNVLPDAVIEFGKLYNIDYRAEAGLAKEEIITAAEELGRSWINIQGLNADELEERIKSLTASLAVNRDTILQIFVKLEQNISAKDKKIILDIVK